jgi:hypothetical protein
MATEIGPILATAFFKASSSPVGIFLWDLQVAPMAVVLLMYKQLGPSLAVYGYAAFVLMPLFF